MDDEDVGDFFLVLAREVLDEFVVVAVSGEGLDGGEMGFYLVHGSEDGDLFVAAHNLGAQRCRGAVADGEDGGTRVLNVVGEVVFYAPRFHHARSGNDDARAVVAVEALGVLNAAHIVQLLESEWVGIGLDVFLHRLVEAVAVEPENVGGSNGEWAVNEDFHGWQVVGVAQFLERIHDFLCATDGKRWDDEFAPAFGACVLNHHHQILFGLVNGGVQAVAIGGFGNDVIGLREFLGVGENGFVVAADVAGVAESLLSSAFFKSDEDGGAAEHVPGVQELDCEVGSDGKRQVVGNADEVAHALDRIPHRVNRFHGFEALLGSLLVELDGIDLLDAAGVGEHDGAEVTGGGGAEDAAFESVFHHERNQPRVVDVGVGKQNVVDLFRVEAEVAVHVVGIQALALVHSAVQ